MRDKRKGARKKGRTGPPFSKSSYVTLLAVGSVIRRREGRKSHEKESPDRTNGGRTEIVPVRFARFLFVTFGASFPRPSSLIPSTPRRSTRRAYSFSNSRSVKRGAGKASGANGPRSGRSVRFDPRFLSSVLLSLSPLSFSLPLSLGAQSGERYIHFAPNAEYAGKTDLKQFTSEYAPPLPCVYVRARARERSG